jgi:hypothetical protein
MAVFLEFKEYGIFNIYIVRIRKQKEKKKKSQAPIAFQK